MPEIGFSAIGTAWVIDTAEPISVEQQSRIHARIDEFDRTYSRFRQDSLVSRASTSVGSHQFPDDAVELFDLYDELFASTEGAVTPLVGRSLEQLGYDSEYSFSRRGADLAAADWTTQISRDGALVTTKTAVSIDVGAAGKGYLVDIVGQLLHDGGVHEFVIDASGDLLVSQGPARRIGLEHPFDPSLAIGIVEISNGSICASGSNRRVWGEGLHHILDGRTGSPTNDVIATWAIAETALIADGLATALFFTSPARLAKAFDFTFVRMFASGRAEFSPDLPGEVFL